MRATIDDRHDYCHTMTIVGSTSSISTYYISKLHTNGRLSNCHISIQLVTDNRILPYSIASNNFAPGNQSAAAGPAQLDFTVRGSMSDLGGPAEPRRSAAGGAFSGNSAIFDDICPPRAQPSYHGRHRRCDFGDFRRFVWGRHTNICMGPRHSEMSGPRRSA